MRKTIKTRESLWKIFCVFFSQIAQSVFNACERSKEISKNGYIKLETTLKRNAYFERWFPVGLLSWEEGESRFYAGLTPGGGPHDKMLEISEERKGPMHVSLALSESLQE